MKREGSFHQSGNALLASQSEEVTSFSDLYQHSTVAAVIGWFQHTNTLHIANYDVIILLITLNFLNIPFFAIMYERYNSLLN